MAGDSSSSGLATTPANGTRCSKRRQQRSMDDIAQQLAWQVSAQLPNILEQLLRSGHDPDSLQLECSVTPSGQGAASNTQRVRVAAVDLNTDLSPYSSPAPLPHNPFAELSLAGPAPDSFSTDSRWNSAAYAAPISPHLQSAGGLEATRPAKRSRHQYSSITPIVASTSTAVAVRHDAQDGTVRRKQSSSNPALQPSTFQKFVNGIWDSLYSGIRMDPAEVIEQWQAIESSGQPKLLTDAEREVAQSNSTGAFGRMNILTRKVSQTSKTCRSLEVIVQAQWVQCFDDCVTELATMTSREKAKKAAIAQACVDFNWTEKELRNKMGIWRGYHDIKNAAGWAALVFAGTGLYRFAKYRVSFSEETFAVLRGLRHRFELAADTLHRNWRMLLGIVGASTEPKYKGHPHDWVVNGPEGDAIPLPPTYHQWDPDFSYKHIEHSVVDEDAWGDYDPRDVSASNVEEHRCQSCNELQSEDTTQNACHCYPNLYGSTRPSPVPFQLFRTPDGKNNGLIACCGVENGWAVGEFVGEITSGLTGLDVMVGQTDHATYQIWQGKQGNHTRFVNHSCNPNSQFERFVWLGKQRIVLASLGIDAGDEVTVDYGDTYWHNLDKICKCGQPSCRYKDRDRHAGALPIEAAKNADAGDGADEDMDGVSEESDDNDDDYDYHVDDD